MGKIILEFDSIEEQNEARTALDGVRWKSAMWELDQKLRNTTKYDASVSDANKASESEIYIAERYREIIRDILQEHELNFD